MKPTFAITSGLILGTLAGVAFASPPPAAPAASPHPDVAFQGVRLWHWKASALDGIGTARTLVYDRSGGQGTAQVAVADLPGLHGDPRPVHLEAGTAHGQLATRQVDASDGVRLRREDGTAASRSAHYDGPAQRITGREPATVDSARFHVTGVGFDVDTARGTLDLGGPVEAHGEGSL